MSINREISKDRKPRVHLTYEVQVGDAFKKVDIPFVVGVLADLSGQRKEPLKDLNSDSRRFVTVGKKTFEEVIAKVRPRLEFAVPNKLQPDGKSLKVEMDITSMDDFLPDKVIQNTPALKALAETRRQMHEFLLRTNSSAKLDKLVQDAITNTEKLNSLSDAIGETGTKREGEEKPNE